mmetsp:Transcript_83373/g.249863  ORF Transcript_83373/g.249863 Transcript_83373/m.249863 type:complete len:280 (-) Transcript_83373:369-1208(-)
MRTLLHASSALESAPLNAAPPDGQRAMQPTEKAAPRAVHFGMHCAVLARRRVELRHGELRLVAKGGRRRLLRRRGARVPIEDRAERLGRRRLHRWLLLLARRCELRRVRSATERQLPREPLVGRLDGRHLPLQLHELGEDRLGVGWCWAGARRARRLPRRRAQPSHLWTRPVRAGCGRGGGPESSRETLVTSSSTSSACAFKPQPQPQPQPRPLAPTRDARPVHLLQQLLVSLAQRRQLCLRHLSPLALLLELRRVPARHTARLSRVGWRCAFPSCARG